MSVAESNIQSEACVEATLKNIALADIEFGDKNYMLVTSDKKLTQSNEQAYSCEVNITWGAHDINTQKQRLVPENLEESRVNTNVNNNNSHITFALGQSLAFEASKGYQSLTNEYLSGTYTTKNNTGNRLIINRNRIGYNFEENGKNKKTKPFVSIGIGIEKPIIAKKPFQLLVRLDVVEPFPFSQILKTDHDDKTIEKKVNGSNLITIGLPLRYSWNDLILSTQLSRIIYTDSSKVHPYNISFDMGYRW